MAEVQGKATIRQALPSDARGIARVFVESWRWTYRDAVPASTLEGMAVEGYVASWRETLLTRPRSMRVWVAEVGGTIVGFAQSGPSRDDDIAQGEVGEVYAIYLLPEQIRGGLGRQLLDEAVGFLREQGYAEATLWVLASNDRARRFYEGAGWMSDGAVREEAWEGATLREARYRLRLGGLA